MQANTKSPYQFIAVIEEGDDSVDVPAVPIPPRSVEVETQPEPINPNGIQRGMKCAWGRTIVRAEAVDLDEGIAEVYVINRPDLVGPAKLANLVPVATPAKMGDKVLLWAGEGRPVTAIVMDTKDNTALFFSPVYADSLWLHTSMIVSTCPRYARR